MLFTIRGATGLIRQRHQILHLPRHMTLMSDVRHIWNVIYNVRSNKSHPPTSPNAAPATKSDTPRSPNTATKSDTPKSPNTVTATKSGTPRSPNAVPATKRSPNVVPATKSATELLLDWAVALLSCYFSELLL